jgi:hypothetical protein
VSQRAERDVVPVRQTERATGFWKVVELPEQLAALQAWPRLERSVWKLVVWERGCLPVGWESVEYAGCHRGVEVATNVLLDTSAAGSGSSTAAGGSFADW